MKPGDKVWTPGGYATAWPTLDFETYSEAGYVWDEATQKWKPPRGIKKAGIGSVGMHVYAEHPSTDVLCFAYDLLDGAGSRIWLPHMDPPEDLLAWIKSGGIVEACNAGFEFLIWSHVLRDRWGWPGLPLEQMRCVAAKARAYGLPGALADMGAVLGLDCVKSSEGAALIRRFCIPRNPTAKDKSRRKMPGEDPDRGPRLYEYCKQDVAAELAASLKIPDLSPELQEIWFNDQRINNRGVYLDSEGTDACIHIIEEAFDTYAPEVSALTDGLVETPSQVSAILQWMHGLGVHADNLDDEAVEELLERDLPEKVRRVLEVRALLSSGSVKKLYALKARQCRDGRVKGLFVFHKARTGRYAGEGPQPQNFPSSGPDWGGDWNADKAEAALAVIKTRSLGTVEAVCGPALKTVAGCLRSLLCAAPGRELICSDYRAIEAVVLAALAGEEWRLDVFRTHGLIYETSAAKIRGIPVETYIEYKREHGHHHKDRKMLGKVAELACFTRDTPVLTPDGYVGIMDAQNKLVWDGETWVKHGGVVSKGKRRVGVLDGVKMTPNHPINCGRFWREAGQLVSSKNTRTLALAKGSANLPWSEKQNGVGRAGLFTCPAPAVEAPTGLASETYSEGNLRGATGAPKVKRSLPGMLSTMTYTPHFSRTQSTAAASSTGYPPHRGGAKTRKTRCIRTMEGGVYGYVTNGKKTAGPSSSIVKPLRGGITQTSRWIGSTATKGMSPGISDLSRGLRMRKTKGTSPNCRLALLRSKRASRTWRNVYDLLDAGPNNQFTIRTRSGHMVVHNSGYRGWLGAWKAFGADQFFSDEEIKSHILAWRDASPRIVEFWGGQPSWRRNEYYGVEGAAILAVMNPGQAFGHNGLLFQMQSDVLFLRLLSGRLLTYHRPRLEPSERYGQSLSFETWNTNPKYGPMGWARMYTHGGKLTENIVQATSWDILVHAQLALARAGLQTVLHVHDENAGEIDPGSWTVERYEAIMGALPAWAKGWPVIAAGGWIGKRYRKD